MYIIQIITLLSVFGFTNSIDNWDQQFEQKVQAIIQQIEQSDPRCTNWSNYAKNIQSFGPNSKQWIVTIMNHNTIHGYAIVGVDTFEDIVLLEYGFGDYGT